MRKNFKVIFSSLVVAGAAIGVTVGTTTALFTSESHSDVNIQAGKLKVSATIKDMKLYSANYDDVNGTLVDENGDKYVYQVQNEKFFNGGTAVYDITTKLLKIQHMTPGDKIDFNVALSPEDTNISYKYRTVATVMSGLKLYRQLNVVQDGITIPGYVKSSNWKTVNPGYDLGKIAYTVEFPINKGNEYQELSTEIKFEIEAVQANAHTTDHIMIEELEEGETDYVEGENLVVETAPKHAKVTVPSGATWADTLSGSVKLEVTPIDSRGTITALVDDPLGYACESYDIHLTPALAATNTTPVLVELSIGTGKKGVQIFHGEDLVDGVTYNEETGKASFYTFGFSEYHVVYNADWAVEEKNGQVKIINATENHNKYEVIDEKTGEVVIKELVIDEDTGEERLKEPGVTESKGLIFDPGDPTVITGAGTFEDENLIVPLTVTKIGPGAFKDKTFIKSVYLPSARVIIDESAFEGCSAIENIVVDNKITEVTNFNTKAFKNCSSLKSVIVNADVVLNSETFYCNYEKGWKDVKFVFNGKTEVNPRAFSFDGTVAGNSSITFNGDVYFTNRNGGDLTTIMMFSPLRELRFGAGIKLVCDYRNKNSTCIVNECSATEKIVFEGALAEGSVMLADTFAGCHNADVSKGGEGIFIGCSKEEWVSLGLPEVFTFQNAPYERIPTFNYQEA